jgi:hypothetical protein
LIPAAKPGGRPRKTDMRVAMNAIFYLLRTGCPWRYLPLHDGKCIDCAVQMMPVTPALVSTEIENTDCLPPAITL